MNLGMLEDGILPVLMISTPARPVNGTKFSLHWLPKPTHILQPKAQVFYQAAPHSIFLGIVPDDH